MYYRISNTLKKKLKNDKRCAMRSVVLDFKNSEFIHKFLKIQVKPHQIAYSYCSCTFSLEVRLKSMLVDIPRSNLA